MEWKSIQMTASNRQIPRALQETTEVLYSCQTRGEAHQQRGTVRQSASSCPLLHMSIKGLGNTVSSKTIPFFIAEYSITGASPMHRLWNLQEPTLLPRAHTNKPTDHKLC